MAKCRRLALAFYGQTKAVIAPHAWGGNCLVFWSGTIDDIRYHLPRADSAGL